MRIEGDSATIETAEEASAIGWSAFIDERTCHRILVLEAITPKEWDAVFLLSGDGPMPYYQFGSPVFGEAVKANALTISKTVGELRRLIEWAKGEEGV